MKLWQHFKNSSALLGLTLLNMEQRGVIYTPLDMNNSIPCLLILWINRNPSAILLISPHRATDIKSIYLSICTVWEAANTSRL